MHSLAVYVKEGFTSAWDLSLENSRKLCRFLLRFSTGFICVLLQSSDYSENCLDTDAIFLNTLK